MLIIAVLLGLFAWYHYRDANQRRQEADQATIAAQRSDSLAQRKRFASADTARMATLAALRSDSLTKREKTRADQAW